MGGLLEGLVEAFGRLGGANPTQGIFSLKGLEIARTRLSAR